MPVNLPLLFDPNPLPDEYTVPLFHNRDRELVLGLAKLKTAGSSQKILAIHGDTRTGKSHFAHRLLRQAVDEMEAVGVIVNANQRETAQHVLEDLFGELSVQLDLIPRAEATDWDVYDEFTAFTQRMRPLVYGMQESIELSVGEKLFSKSTDKLALKPQFIELELGSEESRETSSGHKSTVRAPKNKQLAEMTRWVAEALSHLTKKHILLLIDDQDLLTTTEAGRIETATLVGCLKLLAASPSITVLVTVRTKSWGALDKDFSNFVRIHAFKDDEIKKVYRLRLDNFNDGEEVFSSTALSWLIATSDGRVGMFLQRCERVHDHFFGLDRKINKGDVKKYIRVELDDFMSEPTSRQLMASVFETLRKGEAQIQADGLGEDSPLYLTVLQPRSSGTVFLIDPVYQEVIRDLLAEES